MSLEGFQLQPVHIAALVALVVFLCSLVIARLIVGRGTIRGRIAGEVTGVGWDAPSGRHAIAGAQESRARSLLGRIGTLAQPKSSLSNAALRRQLVQAGFFTQSSVAIYHGTRVACGAGFAVLLPLLESMFELDLLGSFLPLGSTVMAAFGVILPSVWLDRRRSTMRTKYRNAFPDFMDLLVVCIEAGQSLNAAIERVSQEIVQFSPEFGANLHLVSLELRAGRTLVEAFDSLHGRVGIEEVKSLQVLLKQSEELGSSIATTLRVFSEEMREKRMSRAEAKAYALPVKMTVPLGIFIFPVILMVILVPIIIRVRIALVQSGV